MKNKLILTAIFLMLESGCAMADTLKLTDATAIIAGYSLDEWANAIRKAEGNKNYGILSVKCNTTKECRQICKNTVKNNWKRYIKKDKTPTFREYLSFLAKRYCPINCWNDNGTNKFWEKNVMHFLLS